MFVVYLFTAWCYVKQDLVYIMCHSHSYDVISILTPFSSQKAISIFMRFPLESHSHGNSHSHLPLLQRPTKSLVPIIGEYHETKWQCQKKTSWTTLGTIQRLHYHHRSYIHDLSQLSCLLVNTSLVIVSKWTSDVLVMNTSIWNCVWGRLRQVHSWLESQPQFCSDANSELQTPNPAVESTSY